LNPKNGKKYFDTGAFEQKGYLFLPLTHTLFTHEGNDIITKDNAKNI
jgi:hypothetical protein